MRYDRFWPISDSRQSTLSRHSILPIADVAGMNAVGREGVLLDPLRASA